MSFLASYKHLEKLCGEVMNDNRRITAYIEEMEAKSRGTALVPGWNEDLRKLKHYRWVRNQIVHDPDCCEEDLCEPWDAQWLDDFHGRIMEQTDPLTLYRRAMEPPKPAPQASPQTTLPQTPGNGGRRQNAGCAAFLLGAAVILLLLL